MPMIQEGSRSNSATSNRPSKWSNATHNNNRGCRRGSRRRARIRRLSRRRKSLNSPFDERQDAHSEKEPAGSRRYEMGTTAGSSRHQDRQVRLVKNRSCDTAEHPLAYIGVAIRTHNQEIGTESGGPGKQEAAYLLAVGRYAVYPHLRAMVSQVTRDIRPWLLVLIHRVALVIDNQKLHRVRFDKQRQSIRHGTDGLPRGVPCHQDASNLRCRAVWRKQDDGPPGTQDQ